jgi:Radical SAM superfamily
MTITHDAPVTPTTSPISAVWVELTGKCQLECLHCYAGSGPDGTHGTMTAETWEKALTDASQLGAGFVCFIGGEPTLHPDLPRLVRHALSLSMQVEVFSNLVKVSPELWELFELPGVHIATSWYSSDRMQHKQITGRDSHRQTLANIEETIRRGIPLRVGVIDGIVPGQNFEEGKAMLRERGVTNIGGDHLREFGRGKTPDPSQACGNCGNHRLAVLPDGSVTPCPLTRWMTAGNALETPLADLAGAVTEMARVTLPNWRGRSCGPDHCIPYKPPCMPEYRDRADCAPEEACNPDDLPPGDVRKPAVPNDCIPNGTSCRPDGCYPVRAAETITDCTPGDCNPEACQPYDKCWPDACGPIKNAVQGKCFPEACGPDVPCAPDHKCTPDLTRADVRPCEPDNDCAPDPSCWPECCKPVKVETTVTMCQSDALCNPECNPGCMPGHSCGPDRSVTQSACNPDGCAPDDPKCMSQVKQDIVGHAAQIRQAECVPEHVCRPSYCRPGYDTEMQGPEVAPCIPNYCQPDWCAPSACNPDKSAATTTACRPDGDNPCAPEACYPDYTCNPDRDVRAAVPAGRVIEACEPHVNCNPDHRCYPDKCSPDPRMTHDASVHLVHGQRRGPVERRDLSYLPPPASPV